MQVERGERWRVVTAIVLCASAVAASMALYLYGGATNAFLVADDFQWLLGGQTLDWAAFSPTGRDHFYRPTTTLWFGVLDNLCGSSSCYHAMNIVLHGMNVGLLFALVAIVTRQSQLAFAAAVVFGVLPAYVQAVLWVSAVTALLATTGMLLALIAQTLAWSSPWRVPLQAMAIAAFAMAVGAHEAAAVLPVVSAIASRTMGPPHRRERPLFVGYAAVLLLFAVSAFYANRENYVFREGHYAIGPHMAQSVLDYIVSILVFPHSWAGYLAGAIALGLLWVAHPLGRFGVLWMLVAMLPFAGFTWGNVGRYTYLPAVGFGVAVAGIVARFQPARNLTQSRRRLSVATIALIFVLLMSARFASFTVRGVRGDVVRFEPAREYLNQLQALGLEPVNRRIEVPAPANPEVGRQYVETMLRWLYRDPHLEVVIR